MIDTNAKQRSRVAQRRYELAGGTTVNGGGPAVTRVHRALVIDDDQDMVKLLRTFLTSMGWEMIAAYDAMQGFMVAQREQPDLVLVDLHMPAGGGWSLVERLRWHPRTTALPIVIMTADAAEGLKAKAEELGANELLRKPLTYEVVADLVRRLVPA